MKTSLKILLMVIALALVVCLVWLVARPDERDEPAGASVSDTSGVPSFEVHVEKPRLARFLFGILPVKLEAKLFGNSGYLETTFNHASRGAKFGSVGHDRLELGADDWELLIETDAEGRVAPGTRLVFPIELAERQRTLRCRPADEAVGYLRATPRAGSDVLDGRFVVELATCENAETREVIEWPPAPLTVRGSFRGLPHVRR
ncbi:MAG TPA: hypothetical protein VEZ40_00020 [Pyrinomonadaceae bacterium]|nr:hypothetical protein [Pyrinomonadaceae bacterium]